MSGYRARVDPAWDAAAWRDAARRAWAAGLAPHQVDWDGDAQAGLLPWPSLEEAPPVATVVPMSVPASFIELAARVACHRDPQRHALLYRLAWRIGRGERHLLERATDPDVLRARELEKAVV